MTFVKMLRGLLPWILFSMARGRIPMAWLVGAWLALLAYLIYGNFKELRAGNAMALTNVALFIATFINGRFILWPWGAAHAGTVSYCTLGTISAAGLAVGRPFTVTYARATVPQEKWNHPLFLRINFVVTCVWTATFLFNAALTYCLVLPHAWFSRLPTLAVVFGAMTFSHRYPETLRSRARNRVEA